MRKTIFLAAAAITLLGANPALADDRREFHGANHQGSQGHQDHRGDGHHDDGDHRNHDNHGGNQYRGYRPPVQVYGGGYRPDLRQDYRQDRRIYRDGYYDGQRNDYAYQRRIYRDQYFNVQRGEYCDGRRYSSFSYRPHFRAFYQYDRPYYRYDQYDAAWSRPYVIGRPLPGNLRYSRIRDGYYGGLPPCPDGYYYANVGGDILLLSLATNLVVDALLFGDRF